MTRLGNDLEVKEIIYFSLWDDVGVLQWELKIKHRVNKLKNGCNSAMAHLTCMYELCW